MLTRTLGIALLMLLGCGRTGTHQPAPAKASGGAGGAVGTDPEPSEAGAPSAEPCAGVGKLVLVSSQVSDESGDGLYDTSELLRVVATVTSVGGPARAKLVVEHDDPRLTLESNEDNSTFDLVPGELHTMTLLYSRAEQVCCGTEVDFSLTLRSAVEASCGSQTVVGHRAVVANTADDLRSCDNVRSLRLSEPELVDSSGDGLLEAGEDFDVRLTLGYVGKNPVNTPGVSITPSEVEIVSRDGSPAYQGMYLCTHYFLMVEGDEQDITCEMRAEPTLPSGSTAKLLLEARTPHARCHDVDSVEYTLAIE